MSEAKQLHDDLLNALLPILPRRAYQDIHRLNTLVWAITGLCLTHTVRLGAWAEIADQPSTVCRQPGAPFLPLVASSCDPATGVVCPDLAGSPG